MLRELKPVDSGGLVLLQDVLNAHRALSTLQLTTRSPPVGSVHGACRKLVIRIQTP